MKPPAISSSIAPSDAISRTEMPGVCTRGKVRDIYDLPDGLLIVATDRISAFDVVMEDPVPDKGRILNTLSAFWLNTLPACRPHHLEYVVTRGHCPEQFQRYAAMLDQRAMVVKQAEVMPIECVVRGYLAGGGWKEYRADGRVSGVELPRGLVECDRLERPIFTPSTKAVAGHDEPIGFERAEQIAIEFAHKLGHSSDDGRRWIGQARSRALDIYEAARVWGEARGVIIADTKFEFGVRDGQLLLVDEVLTPDSSRFWPKADYRPGRAQPSFDKQYLREYLESLDWDKRPPPPPLPPEVIENTRRRYRQALELLTAEAA